MDLDKQRYNKYFSFWETARKLDIKYFLNCAIYQVDGPQKSCSNVLTVVSDLFLTYMYAM